MQGLVKSNLGEQLTYLLQLNSSGITAGQSGINYQLAVWIIELESKEGKLWRFPSSRINYRQKLNKQTREMNQAPNLDTSRFKTIAHFHNPRESISTLTKSVCDVHGKASRNQINNQKFDIRYSKKL